jgi:hypothetical protein
MAGQARSAAPASCSLAHRIIGLRQSTAIVL